MYKEAQSMAGVFLNIIIITITMYVCVLCMCMWVGRQRSDSFQESVPSSTMWVSWINSGHQEWQQTLYPLNHPFYLML